MGQKMYCPDHMYVFSCLRLLMTTLRSKKEGQPLGKAGVGWSGLRWPPARRGCESLVARGGMISGNGHGPKIKIVN